MRRNRLVILLAAILLAGCNLPTGPGAATPTPDAIATQVSQLLTKVPSPTTLSQPTAVASATSEPSQTPVAATPTTAGPTAAPTQAKPTPTTPSGDPKNSLGTPTWRDPLDSGKSFYQYENDNTRVKLENGALVLSGLTADGWMGWSLTHSHNAQNFYVEATFKTQTCSGSDMYGLVFRAPSDDAGYFYAVTCDGKFTLHARNFADNSNVALVDSTANNVILSGSNQTNRLGVMAKGNTIGLYVNGVLLIEVNDSTFKDAGYFGALIAANATPGFTVNMEEISLWVLP